MTNEVTADAVALQERDDFRADGWVKVIAPAKVNLHLAIGGRRPDGYHDAVSLMHALNLHDVVYVRAQAPDAPGCGGPTVRMVPCGDVPAPDVPPADNLASRAVVALAERTGRSGAGLELRIEKNIPAQAGLGGGSSDAAAALVGAARVWGLDANDAALEDVARSLGSDVAFFLHGGCARFVGTGDEFAGALVPSHRAVALVKPTGGVSTADAYRAFDDNPQPVPADVANAAESALAADGVRLFNNLAGASERLMPELADTRAWLQAQPGVQGALLCGSGAATFAVCADFARACSVVAGARKRGWWARATSFGSSRALVVS